MSDIFDCLDQYDEVEDKIIRAPFGWPGGKSRSILHILPRLPYREAYIEPFGGSGTVLLGRRKSKLEVFNDRYSGVVSFYRVIRDKAKMEALCERLALNVCAREEFAFCKDWENVTDDVERAARWFYMIQMSFGSLGRNFGRATKCGHTGIQKVVDKIPEFFEVHQRLKNVIMENRDWKTLVQEYDSRDAVFYMDPPYVDVFKGTYKHELSIDEHRELLYQIFKLKGFVAISGYDNPLYDQQDWDDKYYWEYNATIQSLSESHAHIKRKNAKECLWIKEVR